MDSKNEQDVDPSLAELFEGQEVKIYLLNGKVMVGTAAFKGKFVHVRDSKTEREVIANMDHVISMARR